MDVDCDDAPFELTELDHLALAKDYARALALTDAQAQASDAYASDDSDNDSLEGSMIPTSLISPHL